MAKKDIAAIANNLALMYMMKIRSGSRLAPEDITDEFVAVRRRIYERIVALEKTNP